MNIVVGFNWGEKDSEKGLELENLGIAEDGEDGEDMPELVTPVNYC